MWYNECGVDADVVLSSRVRLARNIKGIPFPRRANAKQQSEILEICKNAILNTNNTLKDTITMIDMSSMEEYEKQALAERHLISPQFINDNMKNGLLLSDDNKISIMINEEDHIRIQCMTPGFDLDSCLSSANSVDDVMEAEIEYAFDEQFGYLTCCPTNVGTGMRASVMVHLPALVMSGTITKISNSLSQLGFAVRGIYGEGSKAIGNIFQISNQLTMGATEDEVIDKLKQVINEVIDKERELRKRIYEADKFKVSDTLLRSYGILKNAVIMSSTEAMKRISDVRFGIYLGIVSDTSLETMNKISYAVLPANIIKDYNISDVMDRDLKRAEIIKELLRR
ncbi:MAG: protein arginine kinase [Oscillospiraceae bacterium]